MNRSLKSFHDKMSREKEIDISPKFYATNIQRMASVDTSSKPNLFLHAIDELKSDRNKDAFIRDDRFERSWKCLQDNDRKIIVEILVRTCAAEYSGFLMYRELAKELRDKNPHLSEAFKLMSRDEARHASFLNQALADFNHRPSLAFLSREARSYISVPFSSFVYTTYLSEKLSSIFYLTVLENLKNSPKCSVYPLFTYYQAWSEDESRHGDLFAAIIKTQPCLSSGFKARLVCKFHLLLAYYSTYTRQVRNSDVLSFLGLDARKYSRAAICNVNNVISDTVPLVPNVNHRNFFTYLDACIQHIEEAEHIAQPPHPLFVKTLRKIPHYISVLGILTRLFLMKSISSDA